MKQAVSVVTLGVEDLALSGRFYRTGFGWSPVFRNEEIAFYQMNGFVLGTWLRSALAADTQREVPQGPGAFSLAHNVSSPEEVDTVIGQLLSAGGRLLRAGDAPAHGGYRGYVADPDDHAWEIAWNPAWAIDEEGYVTFGL
jgi:catechol 2,3-dioxygenase-like lactoylglutathione lyase family enzyme